MWNDDFHHSAMVAVTGLTPCLLSTTILGKGTGISVLQPPSADSCLQGQYYRLAEAAPGGGTSNGPSVSACVAFLTESRSGWRTASTVMARSSTSWQVHCVVAGPLTALLLSVRKRRCSSWDRNSMPTVRFCFSQTTRNPFALRFWLGRRQFLKQFPGGCGARQPGADSRPRDGVGVQAFDPGIGTFAATVTWR